MITAGSVTIVIDGTALPGRTCGNYLDVEVGLQVGKETQDAVAGDAKRARWSTEARVARDASRTPVLRGPAIHGKSGERFLYLVWRARGSKGPEMFRRAKLQLDAVPRALVEEALAAGRPLLAELGLTDACGAPLCASVRPPAIRWSLGAPAFDPDGGGR